MGVFIANPSVHGIELAHKDTKEDSFSLRFHNHFILPGDQERKSKKEGREGAGGGVGRGGSQIIVTICCNNVCL